MLSNIIGMLSRVGKARPDGFFFAARKESSPGVPIRFSSVPNSRSSWEMWICAFG
jgi:hypothetical protein